MVSLVGKKGMPFSTVLIRHADFTFGTTALAYNSPALKLSPGGMENSSRTPAFLLMPYNLRNRMAF